ALEAVEDRILAGNTGKAVLDDILTIKRHILELRRSLGPQREVIGRLARRDFPFVSERAIIYFRDIQDHVVRLYELLEMQRDLLSGAMDAYRSTLSNRMNQVMQRLTALSTIFLPLTFIAGVYGMNFNPQASPWNMPELSWPWGYPLILGFMAGLAGVMFIYMWRHRWL
ncbi:MAG: magnesium and cobalt transport protein CorA, partial [Deinococcus sp.]|nr:magnesium and cobalt transport protein CorA [Deinococcus sp.]